MLKKLPFVLATLTAVFLPMAVMAQYGLQKTAGVIGYDRQQSLFSMAGTVVGAGLALTGILFFAFTIYAGIRWMLARGNDEYAEKARHTLEAASIGFIIIVLSYALTRFVLSGLVR